MKVNYEELMDDCQQLAAYYEDALWEKERDLEFLKEVLKFLADRYDFLRFVGSLPWYG